MMPVGVSPHETVIVQRPGSQGARDAKAAAEAVGGARIVRLGPDGKTDGMDLRTAIAREVLPGVAATIAVTTPENVAQRALAIADAFIAEASKGK